MPGSTGRLDALGRAFAGSQLQVQIYPNRRQQELSDAVLGAIPALALGRASLVWVSPREELGFSEYRDEDFLRVLGLSHLAARLAEFWPRRGPVWDALAVAESSQGRGAILIEAKSHPAELLGAGCRAGPVSRPRIEMALTAAKRWAGADAEADWTGPLYQHANRLAHLYFLRRAGIEAWFVNLLFLDDPIRPTDRAEWEAVLAEARRQLGLSGPAPYTVAVFLPALERRELLRPSVE